MIFRFQAKIGLFRKRCLTRQIKKSLCCGNSIVYCLRLIIFDIGCQYRWDWWQMIYWGAMFCYVYKIPTPTPLANCTENSAQTLIFSKYMTPVIGLDNSTWLLLGHYNRENTMNEPRGVSAAGTADGRHPLSADSQVRLPLPNMCGWTLFRIFLYVASHYCPPSTCLCQHLWGLWLVGPMRRDHICSQQRELDPLQMQMSCTCVWRCKYTLLQLFSLWPETDLSG